MREARKLHSRPYGVVDHCLQWTRFGGTKCHERSSCRTARAARARKHAELAEQRRTQLEEAIKVAKEWVVQNTDRLLQLMDEAAAEGHFTVDFLAPDFMEGERARKYPMVVYWRDILPVLEKELTTALGVPVASRCAGILYVRIGKPRD